MDSGKIQQSLEISWKEGIPAAVMLGILEYYLVPFGLFLGATTQQIGFLIAWPHLLASLSQLFAIRAVRLAGSRLGLLVWAATLQAALLLPLSLLSFLPFTGQITLLIFLTVAFRVLGSLLATAWGSLMSDYLPAERRGRYFGWRSRIVGVASVAGVGLAGATLFFTKRTFPALGFFILFLSASLFRFLSAALLSKMADLPMGRTAEGGVAFDSNFVKFVSYVSGMMFMTFLAAPYFSVFMLRDLGFNYLGYMSVHLAAVIAGLIAYPVWGRHADRLGNVRILKVTGAIIPVIPLLWLLSNRLPFLIAVEMFSGVIWGGFMLCATNFIYDSVVPEKRVGCLGYFNLLNGVAVFGGASLGGWLAGRLPPVRGFPLLTLFGLSGSCRLLVHLLLAPRFQEVRSIPQPVSGSRLFLSVVGLRPLEGLSREWNEVPSAPPSPD